MKLTYTEGCTTYNLSIDGKCAEDLTVDEKKEIMKSLIDKYEDICDFKNMIIDFLEMNAEPEFKYHCDQCGDSVYEYTLEI